MAKITVKAQKIFAADAGPTEIGVIGSLAAGTPTYDATKDPDLLQALSNYLDGLYSTVVGSNSPAMQDINALYYLITRQLAYLYQTGIPEWNATTTYYIGSVVNNGTGVLFYSLVDDNLNQALTDTTKWRSFAYPAPVAVSASQAIVSTVSGIVYNVTTASAAVALTLPAAPVNGFTFTVKDVGGNLTTNAITIVRAAAESIEGLAATYTCEANYGNWTFQFNGTNWYLIG